MRTLPFEVVRVSVLSAGRPTKLSVLRTLQVHAAARLCSCTAQSAAALRNQSRWGPDPRTRACSSPLPLLPAAGAAEGDGAAAKPAGDATQESLDAVKAGAAAGGGEAEQQDAKGDGEKDEAAPAKTPARGIAFEPSRAPEATPIPFMCQVRVAEGFKTPNVLTQR